MADMLSVDQSTISRWDNGLSHPNREQMAQIRARAIDLGLVWDDSWFFAVPTNPEAADQAAE